MLNKRPVEWRAARSSASKCSAGLMYLDIGQDAQESQQVETSTQMPVAKIQWADMRGEMSPEMIAQSEKEEYLAILVATYHDSPIACNRMIAEHAYARLCEELAGPLCALARQAASYTPDPSGTYEEMLAIARISVWNSLLKWRPRGAPPRRFSRRLVLQVVKGELLRQATMDARPVDVPEKTQRYVNEARRAMASGITLEEHMANCPLSEEMKAIVTRCLQTSVRVRISEEQSGEEDDEASGGYRNSYTILSVTDGSQSVATESTRQYLLQLLERLPASREPERHAVIANYGLDGGEPRTLEAIAAYSGVTRERIRQRVQWAIRQMRKMMEREGIKNTCDVL